MNRKTGLYATSSLAALLLSAAPAHARMGGQAGAAPVDPQAAGTQAAKGQTREEPTDAEQSASPPGAADVALPTPGDTADAGEDIVVTGLRRSVESSQAIKRDSDQFVDAIVANDIGKLPDLTASAALARITGVQVNRAAGEAAQVQVRGLPDITTTYNGREIFTAENRNVAIQDFPAGSVAALEVFKSSTANLIEGGVGGQVNVRSRRPFDFEGFEASGAANGVYTDQAGKFGYNGNFLVSNRWDTGIGEIGVLVNAAYTQLTHLDATREQSFVIGPPPELAATTPFAYPDGQAIFYGSGKRWRPSATATIQWKPTPELEIYADGLFQGFRSRDENRYLFSPLFGGGIDFTNVQLQENGRQAQSLTASGGLRPEGFTGAVKAKTDTYQGAVGAIYKNNGLRISGDVAYTDTTFELTSYNIDHNFASTPIRDVNFDVPRGDGGPEFNFRDFNGADPNNYIFRGLFQENLRGAGDDVQARLDVEYDTGFEFLPRIQFGGRFNDRDALRRRGDRYQYVEPQGIRFPSLPLQYENVTPGFAYDSIQPFRTFVQPTFGSIRRNIGALRTIVGLPAGDPPFDPVQAYDADEKAYAAYGQIKYAFDPGLPIDGLIGLRAVRTETTVAGTSRIDQGAAGVTFVPVQQTNKFTDYLPNASLRASLTDKLQLRLAYTQTRTRPNFIDLNPSVRLDPPPGACLVNPTDPTSGPTSPNCIRNINSGNADLRPLQSTNYDLSLEWYFAKAGSLTGALFRREVNGFIAGGPTPVAFDTALGSNLRFNRPQNGGDGRINGAEAALAAFLDFGGIPEWARGFGVQANYTYIDAKAELAPILSDPTVGGAGTLGGRQRLVGVSKHSYNLVALYERPKVSARIAYNYRSNFIDGYFRSFYLPTLSDGPVLPLIHEGLGILDFSANVTPVENITIQFDVSNILGTARKLTRPYLTPDGDTFPRQVIYLERVFSLGVRFRL